MKNSKPQSALYSAVIVDNSLPEPCDEIVMTSHNTEVPVEYFDIHITTCSIEDWIVGMLQPVATFPMTDECHYSRDSVYKALAMMKEHCKPNIEDIWKDPIEHIPEPSKEYLVKINDGHYQVCSWRPAYSIWACQSKDDSNIYKYKEIE